MKIGILTQPLHTNYGGILQAFALQHVLKRMGHEVWTVDIPSRRTLYRECRAILGRFVRKYVFFRKNIPGIFRIGPSKSEVELLSQHLTPFIKKNIQRTETIALVEKISVLKKYNFDAYIVGSDQVWRPRYSPGIPTFFLDFLENDKKTKRIAYAASFGVDSWEYPDDLTAKCRKLAQKFDAISVREAEAVTLCKKYLGVDAEHVLDPTMLLDKEDYIALLDKMSSPQEKKTAMVYVLDKSPDNDRIIKQVSNHLNLTINSVMPNKQYSNESIKTPEDCIFPPITQWLRGFMDAQFVVTDSFHGTVFAIIFNKPFIAIGNQSRGLARFSSLLKIFGLEDRLISTPDELTIDLIDRQIDFEKVNRIRKEQQVKACSFLSSALRN